MIYELRAILAIKCIQIWKTNGEHEFRTNFKDAYRGGWRNFKTFDALNNSLLARKRRRLEDKIRFAHQYMELIESSLAHPQEALLPTTKPSLNPLLI